MKTQVSRIFTVAACLIVLAALVTGFILVGSPGHARLVRLDQRRIEDLKAIRSSVQSYEDQRHRLPQSLAEIAKSAADRPEVLTPSVSDPVTHATYEYRTTGKTSYVLCATFATPANEEAEGTGSVVSVSADEAPSFWAHPQGRHCFSLVVSVAETAASPPAKPAVTKP